MEKNQTPIQEVEGSRVVKITNDSEMTTLLKAATEKSQLVVCDFFANWCPPCRMAAPEFARMSIEYENVVFAKVDVDAAPSVSSEYRVTSLPTFKMFVKGAEVASLTGWRKTELLSLINEHQQRCSVGKRAS